MLSRDNRKSDSDRRSCFRSVTRHYPKKLLELAIRRVEEQVWRNPFDFQKKNNPSLLVSFLSSQKFFQTDTRETKIPLPSFQKASSSSFSSIRTNPLATEYNLVTGKREEASQMSFDSLSTSLPPCKFIRTDSSSFFLNKLDRLETD